MAANDDNVVAIGGLTLRFLVEESHGNQGLVMFEMSIAPNARVPVPHYHREVDEAIYGLEGTLTSHRDGTAHEIRPGDSLFIARGLVHHHENRHDTTARALVVLTPASIGRRYFEEMRDAVSGPAKPDPAQLKEIMLRYGLIPA